MPYFNPETIAEEAIRMLFNFKVRLDRQLYREARTDFNILANYQSAPFYDPIRLLVRIANGEYKRSEVEPEFADEAHAALQDVVETFCLPPFGPNRYVIPDSFYQLPIG